MKNTPLVGVRGRFTLRQPFELDTSRIYKVGAVRSMRELYENNKDVFVEYYENSGLGESDYRRDKALNANIVTLISDASEKGNVSIVYVPDTYITSFPDAQTPEYHRVVMSIDFGILPTSVQLDDLKERMSSLGADIIGKVPDINLHLGSYQGHITLDEHNAMEAARFDQVQNQDTDRAKFLKEQKEKEDLIERIRTLEQIIMDNGLIEEE